MTTMIGVKRHIQLMKTLFIVIVVIRLGDDVGD